MNKEINFSGKKIFYTVHGKGKPVMLVHGFGEMGEVWNNQVQFLKDKFRLIVPDLPGSGRSEMIDDMSMEGMAEVLKAILDTESPSKPSQREGFANTQTRHAEDSSQEGNDNTTDTSKIPPVIASGAKQGGGASIIGHSMGGYITLAFMEKYWGLLDRFGLFHSTAYADSEEKKAIRRKGIEFILANGAFEFLKTATLNLFSPKTKNEKPQLISDFIQSLNNFSPETLVSYYVSMINRPERISVLEYAKMPVLFVMGEYDNAVPLSDGLKQCYLPEKVYIHILHESGHMGMLEETHKTNRLLEDFLNSD